MRRTIRDMAIVAIAMVVFALLVMAIKPAHAQMSSYFAPTGGGTAAGGTIARCAPGYITRDSACNRPPQPNTKRVRRVRGQ
jgi:hypothetical protein